jgi:5-methylcytosine-specific restriction enzyme subunit McrC
MNGTHRSVTAFEHKLLPISNEASGQSITTVEAGQLEEIGRARPGFCDRFHRGVRLANYAGLVDLGGTTLEVLPKADESASGEECRGMLLKLLRAAGNFPVSKHGKVDHNLRRMNLLEIFISLFFDEVSQLARGGLMRRYIETEDDLQVVRGRILPDQFTRNLNRFDRISCRFDDLTIDNRWNRLLKAGVRLVRPWISSAENDRRWLELILLFDEVKDKPLHSLLAQPLPFDRQAERYSSSICWVKLISRGLVPGLRSGVQSASGLLFDMNAMFERAVGRTLVRRSSGAIGTRVTLQSAGFHLGSIAPSGWPKVIALRPDILIERNSRVVTIADTKWKRLRPSASGYLIPDEADVYQMHAYAAAYQCRDVRLIYPWHSGLTGSKETTLELVAIDGETISLTVICVDLDEQWMHAKRGSLVVGNLALLQAA